MTAEEVVELKAVFGDEMPAQLLAATGGRGVDLAVLTVANAATFAQALGLVRDGGEERVDDRGVGAAAAERDVYVVQPQFFRLGLILFDIGAWLGRDPEVDDRLEAQGTHQENHNKNETGASRNRNDTDW